MSLLKPQCSWIGTDNDIYCTGGERCNSAVKQTRFVFCQYHENLSEDIVRRNSGLHSSSKYFYIEMLGLVHVMKTLDTPDTSEISFLQGNREQFDLVFGKQSV